MWIHLRAITRFPLYKTFAVSCLLSNLERKTRSFVFVVMLCIVPKSNNIQHYQHDNASFAEVSLMFYVQHPVDTVNSFNFAPINFLHSLKSVCVYNFHISGISLKDLDFLNSVDIKDFLK